VAVVIGGASGIGRAMAEAFAAEGAAVAVVDLSQHATAVAAEIGQQGGVRAMGVVADVGQLPAVEQAAEEIHARLGRCDHVVFAAGIGSGKFGYPFWNLSPHDWPRVLHVNLVGAVNVAHAFLPRMVEARRGTFLFVSSVAAQIGSQTDPPYSASKAALLNFAQCAAKDLAPAGVRVNSICPGMVQTPLNRSVWAAGQERLPVEARQTYEAWTAEKIARTVPLGRWQEASDMAAMAVFLASPRARNITGQAINIDGGQVMRF
jgi:NAD(P)-dependent dehydrogenase (short-subunit alcohol dehydrogenase family)